MNVKVINTESIRLVKTVILVVRPVLVQMDVLVVNLMSIYQMGFVDLVKQNTETTVEPVINSNALPVK